MPSNVKPDVVYPKQPFGYVEVRLRKQRLVDRICQIHITVADNAAVHVKITASAYDIDRHGQRKDTPKRKENATTFFLADSIGIAYSDDLSTVQAGSPSGSCMSSSRPTIGTQGSIMQGFQFVASCDCTLSHPEEELVSARRCLPINLLLTLYFLTQRFFLYAGL